MNAQGRCAGCRESGELRRLVVHVIMCPEWARLYRENPAAALSPAAEHARWRGGERAAEHRADLAGRVADTQARRAASVSRFEARDPLED